MAFRRPIKQPFESTMAFSKFFTILPKTGGTLKTFFTIRFFVNMSPLVYFSECSSSAVSMSSGILAATTARLGEVAGSFFGHHFGTLLGPRVPVG